MRVFKTAEAAWCLSGTHSETHTEFPLFKNHRSVRGLKPQEPCVCVGFTFEPLQRDWAFGEGDHPACTERSGGRAGNPCLEDLEAIASALLCEVEDFLKVR